VHIPDGYLGPSTYGSLWAVMVPLWYWAGRKMKQTLRASEVPLLALGAAVSFVIMMINIPIIGGTTGHATGAVLLAIVLGPWAALIAVSIALVVQAVVFGDGGITALGANCFNMAFAGVFAGYFVFRLFAPKGENRKRLLAAAALGGYVGLNVSALFTAVELGVQTILYTAPDGRPLYSPFPLRIAVPAIMLEHLTIFGFAEAAFTALSLAYISKAHPELIKGGFAPWGNFVPPN
jgi:cobalt/nickel transport system permease protein